MNRGVGSDGLYALEIRNNSIMLIDYIEDKKHVFAPNNPEIDSISGREFIQTINKKISMNYLLDMLLNSVEF